MLKNRFILIVSFFIQYNVFACMCYPPTLEREWDYSSHIFTGKILSINQYPSIYMVDGDNKKDYILVEIQESFKGFYTIPKYITLIKVHNSCERSYNENITYIFYCSTFMGMEIMYAPNSCSRTMSSDAIEFTNEIKTLTELRRIKAPQENSQSLRSIETDELEHLRQAATQSKKLICQNKNLHIILSAMSGVILILLLLIFRRKPKIT